MTKKLRLGCTAVLRAGFIAWQIVPVYSALAWEAGPREVFLPISPVVVDLEALPDKGCDGRMLRVSFSAGAEQRDAAGDLR
jgi:hypothetical protein